MKSGPDRKYTLAFRQAAVQQVEAGRGVRAVARSLEKSPKTLSSWIYRARQGLALSQRQGDAPVTQLEAELSRLRAENARLKVEKEILKNRLRGRPRPICIETGGGYTGVTQGQWPFAFWRHLSPSKNLAQGKPRTQLWWHLA